MNIQYKDDLQIAMSKSAGFLLSRASRMLRSQMSEALEPLKLSLNEYIVMRLVAMRVPISQGSLGETYGIDPSSMVALIDRLEGMQLILRERDPLDRRRYNLSLTGKGLKVTAQAKRIAEKVQRRFLDPLTEEEWETARQLLCKLVLRH
jgi:DNA-binding MarR family transcriptional regulator